MNLNLNRQEPSPVLHASKKTPGPAQVAFASEESLVRDDRASVRPAQMVEAKLSQMLKGTFLGVSKLRLQNLIGRRYAR